MQNLKRIREAAGLGQAELARRAGLTPGAVCNLEHARRSDPRYSTVVALAAALGVEPGLLVECSDIDERPSA
jgi:transcriptional regulator with XRE-family HTH domain